MMTSVYFTIALVHYVADGHGDVDRDDEFFPQRYETLEEARKVVETLPDNRRYIIDDHPRQGMFPPWKGWGGRPT